MKKRFIFAVSLILCTAFLLIGCGNVQKDSSEKSNIEVVEQEENEEMSEPMKIADIQEQTEEIADEVVEQDPEPTAEMSDAKTVHTHYLDALQGKEQAEIYGEMQYIPTDDWFSFFTPYYAFYDLNQDGTEELLLKSDYDWLNVYCFRDNKVVAVDNPFYTGATGEIVLNDGYVLLEDTNHGGRFYYEVYKFNDSNQFDLVEGYAHWFPDETTGATEHSYLYFAGEDESTEITGEKYAELKNKYFSMWNQDLIWQVVPGFEDIAKNITTTPIMSKRADLDTRIFAYMDEEFFEYEGDLGEKYPEYCNINLSAEEQNCHIIREIDKESYKAVYRMMCGDKLLFETSPLDIVVNAADTFAFCDINYDGVDEVLVNSYVSSTGGMVIVDSYVYSKNSIGAWEENPFFLYDKGIVFDDKAELTLQNAAQGKFGNYFVRDIEMHGNVYDVLIDFGEKNGGDQILDMHCLRYNIMMEEDKIYLSDNLQEIIWPFDCP